MRHASALLLSVTLLVTESHAQTPAFEIPVCGALIPKPGSEVGVTIETNFKLPEDMRLPEKVDLSKYFPPPGNQHRQYSCTAWAYAYGVMSYRLNLLAGRTYSPSDTVSMIHTFTPAYLFNMLKKFDNSACDTGVDFEKLAEICTIAGCPLLKDLPYDTSLGSCHAQFPTEIFQEGTPYHTPPLVQLDNYNIDQWKYHLAQGEPIITLIVIDSSFFYGGFNTNGQAPFLWDFDHFRHATGGHAVVCTGYEGDSTFTFINSFGKHWGDHGYFKATWDVLQWKCYGGYIMPNDTSVSWIKAPGKPADKDKMLGVAVIENFKEGKYQEINDKKVKLVDLGEKHAHAVVQVFDAKTDTLQQTLTMRVDQPYTFYENGQRIELEYDRRSTIGRLFNKSVPFSMKINAPTDDPFLKSRDEQLKRCRLSVGY